MRKSVLLLFGSIIAITTGCRGTREDVPSLIVHSPDGAIVSLTVLSKIATRSDVIRASVRKHLGTQPSVLTNSLGLQMISSTGSVFSTPQYFIEASGPQQYTLMVGTLGSDKSDHKVIAGPTIDYRFLVEVAENRVIKDLTWHDEDIQRRSRK